MAVEERIIRIRSDQASGIAQFSGRKVLETMAQIRADTKGSYISPVTRDVDVVERLRSQQGNVLLSYYGSCVHEKKIFKQLGRSGSIQLMPDSVKIAGLSVDEIVHRIVRIKSEAARYAGHRYAGIDLCNEVARSGVISYQSHIIGISFVHIEARKNPPFTCIRVRR